MPNTNGGVANITNNCTLQFYDIINKSCRAKSWLAWNVVECGSFAVANARGCNTDKECLHHGVQGATLHVGSDKKDLGGAKTGGEFGRASSLRPAGLGRQC